MKMRPGNAIAPLFVGGTSIAIASAKNYGPTSEHCVEKGGRSCPVDANSTNSSDNIDTSVGPEIFQWTTTEKLAQILTAKKTDEDEDADAADYDDDESLPHGQCGLYLAPSTLPHAGLGLFSGSAIPFDHSVNEYIGGTFPGYDDDKHPPLWTDLFIPIGTLGVLSIFVSFSC
jgi:hypothetical protein